MPPHLSCPLSLPGDTVRTKDCIHWGLRDVLLLGGGGNRQPSPALRARASAGACALPCAVVPLSH